MGLFKGLVPDHNTSANFRKGNPEPIRKIFRAAIKIAKHVERIGGKRVAGDSTKMSAQNAQKNIFSHKKRIEKLKYNETRSKEYNSPSQSRG
jgi:transposase